MDAAMFAIDGAVMNSCVYSQPETTPSSRPESKPSPQDRGRSHADQSINVQMNRYVDQQPPELAPWQKRWNVEFETEARSPALERNLLMHRRMRKKQKSGGSRVTLTQGIIDILDLAYRELTTPMIEAGVLSKEYECKQTRFHRAMRRYAWPLLLFVRDVKEFKRQWREFRERDKNFHLTVCMEEQGEYPRWKAKMTVTVDPAHWELMKQTGQWIDFPSPENVKWVQAHEPGFWEGFIHPGPTPFIVWNSEATQHSSVVGRERGFRQFLERRR
ncbi:hypothetical protein F4808DRAFT_465553 [Astrocystis sublimbata]|nr:hypothetical protein F4808DRAFT_465553 [Astrocystis sublimbata]